MLHIVGFFFMNGSVHFLQLPLNLPSNIGNS